MSGCKYHVPFPPLQKGGEGGFIGGGELTTECPQRAITMVGEGA